MQEVPQVHTISNCINHFLHCWCACLLKDGSRCLALSSLLTHGHMSHAARTITQAFDNYPKDNNGVRDQKASIFDMEIHMVPLLRFFHLF